MRTKRLLSIVKLRRIAVDAARETLVGCLNAETQADALRRYWEDRIWRETEAASGIYDDAKTLTFANWLESARQKLAAARAQYEAASARTGVARASLAAARGALNAAEELWRTAEQANEELKQKRELAELNELFGSRTPSPTER